MIDIGGGAVPRTTSDESYVEFYVSGSMPIPAILFSSYGPHRDMLFSPHYCLTNQSFLIHPLFWKKSYLVWVPQFQMKIMTARDDADDCAA